MSKKITAPEVINNILDESWGVVLGLNSNDCLDSFTSVGVGTARDGSVSNIKDFSFTLITEASDEFDVFFRSEWNQTKDAYLVVYDMIFAGKRARFQFDEVHRGNVGIYPVNMIDLIVNAINLSEDSLGLLKADESGLIGRVIGDGIQVSVSRDPVNGYYKETVSPRYKVQLEDEVDECAGGCHCDCVDTLALDRVSDTNFLKAVEIRKETEKLDREYAERTEAVIGCDVQVSEAGDVVRSFYEEAVNSLKRNVESCDFEDNQCECSEICGECSNLDDDTSLRESLSQAFDEWVESHPETLDGPWTQIRNRVHEEAKSIACGMRSLHHGFETVVKDPVEAKIIEEFINARTVELATGCVNVSEDDHFCDTIRRLPYALRRRIRPHQE